MSVMFNVGGSYVTLRSKTDQIILLMTTFR